MGVKNTGYTSVSDHVEKPWLPGLGPGRSMTGLSLSTHPFPLPSSTSQASSGAAQQGTALTSVSLLLDGHRIRLDDCAFHFVDHCTLYLCSDSANMSAHAHPATRPTDTFQFYSPDKYATQHYLVPQIYFVPTAVQTQVHLKKSHSNGIRVHYRNKMDAVDIPSERVPEGLKQCEQILKRAKELKKAEPVVAYWCKLGPLLRSPMRLLIPKGCFSAAEKVLQLKSRTDEQTMFLMSLLDALEQVSCPITHGLQRLAHPSLR